MEIAAGQRVKLVPNDRGRWLAAISNGLYLDLNDQPTGKVVGVRPGREPAADVVLVAIDGHPAPGRWPGAWYFSPGLLLPAAAGEIRLAPVVDGRGRPVAAETLARVLRELEHAQHADAPMYRAEGGHDDPRM